MKNKDNYIDDLFSKAKNQQPQASFDATKGQFISSLKTGGTIASGSKIANLFTLKSFIIMTTIVSVTIVSVLLLSNPNKTNKEEKITQIEKNAIVMDSITEDSVFSKRAFKVESVSINDENIEITTSTFDESISDTVSITKKEVKKPKKFISGYQDQSNTTRRVDSVYRFPTLTAEQIEENNKQKAKMLKQLIKLDKKKYAFIPSSTFNSGDKKVSVQAFYMQTTEVTVLEYRTFLFDLLIKGRKDDFIKAKPDQTKWRAINGGESSFMEPMVDLYFSHPAYYEYPVNNISREGAEMYCKWLTLEASKVQKKKDQPLNDVRLPSNQEWMLAAYGGDLNQAPFPWNTTSIKNDKDCYLANYKPKVDSMYNRELAKYEICENCNHWIADGAFLTAKVDSYLPNNYGLYCMSGNIAEMVWYWNDNTPGTKGGSWNSNLNELKIYGPDKFKGIVTPNPHIGFRVVMTYLNN